MKKSKQKLEIKPGDIYETRNGARAEVLDIDDPGIRPVCAVISEKGSRSYYRWFTLEGREYADGGASPYDFVKRVGSLPAKTDKTKPKQ